MTPKSLRIIVYIAVPVLFSHFKSIECVEIDGFNHANYECQLIECSIRKKGLLLPPACNQSHFASPQVWWINRVYRSNELSGHFIELFTSSKTRLCQYLTTQFNSNYTSLDLLAVCNGNGYSNRILIRKMIKVDPVTGYWKCIESTLFQKSLQTNCGLFIRDKMSFRIRTNKHLEVADSFNGYYSSIKLDFRAASNGEKSDLQCTCQEIKDLKAAMKICVLDQSNYHLLIGITLVLSVAIFTSCILS